MPVPTIITQFGNPDPNAAPLNLTQLVQLLNTLVSTNMQGSYIPYVISADTPGADDHDKAWIQLDGNGRPIATKIWYAAGGGNWRRIYNGMLNEVRGFSGDPTDLTKWGTTGLGVVGSDYDGWHICNGKDGVIDLSDKFIIGAHMSDYTVGYQAGKWQTNVEGSAKPTGGNANVTLDAAHTYIPNQYVTVYRRSAPGDQSDPAGNLAGVTVQPGTSLNLTVQPPGNTAPSPIDIVNPYIALGWMIFVGYS